MVAITLPLVVTVTDSPRFAFSINPAFKYIC